MIKTLEYLFMFLIFPGFLFSSFMGLIVGWIDRKLTARIQWRVGPPWYQNFVDILKLLYKETSVPAGVPRTIFLSMPIIALASAASASTIICVINSMPKTGFAGDLIIIVLLLIIPSMALARGGFMSGNPYASMGAFREEKLMHSYELPFILSLVVPIMKSGYAIKLGDILSWQHNNGAIIGSLSGVISFLAMLFCVQAKLGYIPFDMAEAETEIVSGPYIEYSGKALAMFKLAKAIMTFLIPIFLITLYFGGMQFSAGGFIKNVLEYTGILVLMVLIKNTNPRVRVDQASRFFKTTITALAVLSVLLSYRGL